MIPIEQVKTMKAQGMDNNQIIQSLQRDGFSSADIFDALNQATSAPSSSTPPPSPSSGPSPVAVPQVNENASTEELVEAVIDEKWNELVKDITTIIEWKDNAQNTIVSLQQQFTDLKGEFDKLHQALIAKVGEYDKNILDVGAEIKAMEKVFSKVLPTFTENVQELSKITSKLKK